MQSERSSRLRGAELHNPGGSGGHPGGSGNSGGHGGRKNVHTTDQAHR